jgi:hypothetical protein
VQLVDRPDAGTAWSVGFTNLASRGNVTDARGIVGLANLDPGPYTVEGIAPVGGPDGTPYGRTTVQVRPGVITLAEIRDGIDKWGQ